MTRALLSVLPDLALLVGATLSHALASVEAGSRKARSHPASWPASAIVATVALVAAFVAAYVDARAPSVVERGALAGAAMPPWALHFDFGPASAWVRVLLLACATTAFLVGLTRRNAPEPRGSGSLLVVVATLDFVLTCRHLLAIGVALEVVGMVVTATLALSVDRRSRASLVASEILGSALLFLGIAFLVALGHAWDVGRVGARLADLAREKSRVPAMEFVAVTWFFVGVCVKCGIPPFARARRDVASDDGSKFALLVVGSLGGVFAVARFLDIVLSGRQVVSSSLDGHWPLFVVLVALLMAVSGLATTLSTDRPRAFVAGLLTLHLAYAELASTPSGSPAHAAVFLELANGAFVVLLLRAAFDRASAADSFAFLRGRGIRDPALGVAVGFVLASSLGLPPTFGFFARLVTFDGLLTSTGPFRPLDVLAAGTTFAVVVGHALALVRFARGFYATENVLEGRRESTRGALGDLVPLALLTVFGARLADLLTSGARTLP